MVFLGDISKYLMRLTKNNWEAPPTKTRETVEQYVPTLSY